MYFKTQVAIYIYRLKLAKEKPSFSKLSRFRNDINLKHWQVGQSIQEWTKYNLWKTAYKKFEGVWSA